MTVIDIQVFFLGFGLGGMLVFYLNRKSMKRMNKEIDDIRHGYEEYKKQAEKSQIEINKLILSVKAALYGNAN